MVTFKNSVFFSVLLLAMSLGAGKAYVDYRLQTELTRSLARLPASVHITYQTAYVTLTGAVQIEKLRIQLPQQAAWQIARVRIPQAYRLYPLDTLPAQLDVYVDKLSMAIPDTPAPVPEALQMLGYADFFVDWRAINRLGYKTLQADMHLTATSGDQQTTARLNIAAGSWGALTLNAELLAVPPPAQWATRWDSIQLVALDGRYQNQGLLNRIFNQLGQRQQTTAVAMQQALQQQLNRDLGNLVDAQILTALNTFLQELDVLQLNYQFSPPFALRNLKSL